MKSGVSARRAVPTPEGVECLHNSIRKKTFHHREIAYSQSATEVYLASMGRYCQIFYQIVFGTKDRRATIEEANCRELYKYVAGIIKNHKGKLYRINGTEDHIHIFSDLHPMICLSDYVKDIKVASNSWMKESGKFPGFEAWQEGYGAFTYSIREKDMIIDYVKNQKEHHKQESFYDEFKRLLIENGIEFDEKYLL